MSTKRQMNQKRYLGLELSGAKNSKTTLATLEYYPKEKKVFLLDVHCGIGADATKDSDAVLIETLLDHANGHPDFKIGVNVPLTLPPCFTCTKKSCAVDGCTLPEVKWMRTIPLSKKPVSKRTAKLKSFFTPYTQRPIELWLKHEVISKLPEKVRFEMDEALGGNKAPLTARMQYLKRHLSDFEIDEVMPKLTVALLMPSLKLTIRQLQNYRKMEDGAEARQIILEKMCDKLDIFIYERDLKKLTQNLNAFDAFLCAYTILLFDRDECVNPPKGFPLASGWIRYPRSVLLDSSASFEGEEDDE
jgi:hypothetical protein